MPFKKLIIFLLTFSFFSLFASSQTTTGATDSLAREQNLTIADSIGLPDTALRILNLNPYFNMHVDSVLSYKFDINKQEEKYYWYLKNAFAGLSINKNTGLFSLKPAKSYFLTNKLQYDAEYKVQLGVQNLNNPLDRVDTSVVIVFYNTEIIYPRVKPTISKTVIAEGEEIRFKIKCEAGSFPINSVNVFSNYVLTNSTDINNCDEEFVWMPNYEFVKETDSAKQKTVLLGIVGNSKSNIKDTAFVTIEVRNALNYPLAAEEHAVAVKNVRSYVSKLKYTFLVLDKQVRKTKKARIAFDMSTATAALSGTVLSSLSDESAKTAGKILPSVGLAIVPVKEVAAPNKNVEQNQATLIRNAIKRLEYMLYDNVLVGENGPKISEKVNKLKDELKQSQVQLIDIPIEVANTMSDEALNEYFQNPKVNKKYRVNRK